MGHRSQGRSPPPHLSEPSARLLFAVEKIAHHLERIDRHMAAQASCPPLIPPGAAKELANALGGVVSDLLAPHRRRR